jgi:hypothetical protein
MEYLQMEPGKTTYARPFDSAAAIPDKPKMVIYWIGLLLVAYVVIRIWFGIRKNNRYR